MKRIPKSTPAPAASAAVASKPAPKPTPTKPLTPSTTNISQVLDAARTAAANPKPAAKAALPALAPSLGEIGGYEAGSVPLPEPRGIPWVGFWTKKASRAGDIVKVLGSVAEGTPYLAAGGSYFPLAQAAYVILAEIRYWAVVNDKNDLVRAWVTEPETDKIVVNRKQLTIKDCGMAIALLLPGGAALPEELRPAQVAVCDFRGTKSPALFDHLKGIEEALTSEWAHSHGDLAATVPPRFRVASSFVIQPKTSRDGNAYAQVKGNTQAATLAQLEAVHAWSQDEDSQAEFATAQERFTQRVAELREFAESFDQPDANTAPDPAPNGHTTEQAEAPAVGETSDESWA